MGHAPQGYQRHELCGVLRKTKLKRLPSVSLDVSCIIPPFSKNFLLYGNTASLRSTSGTVTRPNCFSTIVKGGLELLENKINDILGSKHED